MLKGALTHSKTAWGLTALAPSLGRYGVSSLPFLCSSLHSSTLAAASSSVLDSASSALMREVFGDAKASAKIAIDLATHAAAQTVSRSYNLFKTSSGQDPAVDAEIKQATKEAGMNPLALVGDELKVLSKNAKALLESDHPVLASVAKYYFDQDGKKIRPALVLLMSRACVTTPSRPLSSTSAESDSYVTRPQRRLAEITEMIHTASLVHDDVIDGADVRRSQLSVNEKFGNKMAVLGGDFLLARASLALAQLRNVDVVELLSTVIAHLVEGEFLQMKPFSGNGSQTDYEQYIRKTFLKTASLMAYSCKAAVLLGEEPREDYAEAAFVYGTHLGIAFQLIDDTLDFVGSNSSLGKPAAADLKLGIATLPVLYAADTFPELRTLVERQFSQDGDASLAYDLVGKTDAVRRTLDKASEHCHEAVAALRILPVSPARQALIALANTMLQRTK